MHATFVVGNRNRRDAHNELTRKRPLRSLLQNRHRKRRARKAEPVLQSTTNDTNDTAQTITTYSN